ncbi:MAG TPA: RteC domain-containing protein [Cyclobacteriaceae bacterium]|nr:RteC domain-containing protein [Cyclobacteriaceae bacterium]
MDIKEFAHELFATMQEKLNEVEASPKDSIVKERNYIEIVRSHTYRLKNYLYQYEFSSPQEEIYFYKNIKPKFVSLLLFHNELFEIEVSKPLEKDGILKHYLESLHKGQAFINANMEYYRYFHSGSTYLDSKYFLPDRNNETGNDLIYDSRFCTPYDNKFCTLHAYELLKEHLTKLIDKLGSSGQQEPNSLQWTGAKISLIELMYALQASGVFNKSATDVKMIATYFEKVFNVDLGNYYRTLQDIRGRKNGKTIFLDELRCKLGERLGEPLLMETRR